MKRKSQFFSFLLLLTVFSFSFTSLRSSHKAKARACNCMNINPSLLHGTIVGTNTKLTWQPPSGDPVSHYTFGDYFDCDGGFGPITVYAEQAYVPNPYGCIHGTITMVTHCTNGCVSSGVVATW
ncbi:MAG: hypothetical protein JST47_05845 [Bacteroidetes bacterium]|nr:hypothetical protein [Bacteroidota bacterium]